MMGKRKRSVDPDGSPGARLRGNIVDLYATGKISSDRCASLLDDAAHSNVPSCDLPHATGRARDLQRGLCKQSGWPPLITIDTPLLDREQKVSAQPVAYLLPHEVLYELHQVGQSQGLASTEGLLREMPLSELVPLGSATPESGGFLVMYGGVCSLKKKIKTCKEVRWWWLSFHVWRGLQLVWRGLQLEKENKNM